ncbi:DUF2000 domain-containing protein [Bacteroides ihuae]|uniref:DUF2000 domain-containing protein n=1 Tax=Bacteroides ihuae TaxID=1852362 RepID=UPI0008DA6A49|nr:DUF2000 domain-containing protein [Bacteroides ihuae]
MEDIKTIAETKKCVLIIDKAQPIGIIANTASVLSITLGKQIEGIVSHDVYDKQGDKHLGITQMPIPVLGASDDKIKEIRHKLLSLDLEELVMVDFSNIAQQSKTYDNYEKVMLMTEENDIRYIGIGICGDKKVINKATGNLSLIR